MLWQPMNFLPAPRPAMNASTFSTVRLKTATVNPLLSMLRTRFSPITARPMRPISACAMTELPVRKCEVVKADGETAA